MVPFYQAISSLDSFVKQLTQLIGQNLKKKKCDEVLQKIYGIFLLNFKTMNDLPSN